MTATQRFNERPSPPVENRMIQALQVLKRLRRRGASDWAATAGGLGYTIDDLDEMIECLFQECVGYQWLIECGGCSCYHRPDFAGDCRNDDERFP